MLVLITYDVNTETKEGRRRLQKVAKQCVNYGIRVQNSVFECVLDAAEFRKVKQILIDLIDPEKDSLRFYQLGNRYESKVEHIGVRPSLHVLNSYFQLLFIIFCHIYFGQLLTQLFCCILDPWSYHQMTIF